MNNTLSSEPVCIPSSVTMDDNEPQLVRLSKDRIQTPNNILNEECEYELSKNSDVQSYIKKKKYPIIYNNMKMPHVHPPHDDSKCDCWCDGCDRYGFACPDRKWDCWHDSTHHGQGIGYRCVDHECICGKDNCCCNCDCKYCGESHYCHTAECWDCRECCCYGCDCKYCCCECANQIVTCWKIKCCDFECRGI